MPISIRYRPNNREFGELMRSDQTQDLADQAAGLGVQVAIELARRAGLPDGYVASIKATVGPMRTFGRNPRRTARVEAQYPWLEFGSGSKGRRGNKRKRPQGGYSKPYRVLGKTATRIGKMPTGQGGS